MEEVVQHSSASTTTNAQAQPATLVEEEVKKFTLSSSFELSLTQSPRSTYPTATRNHAKAHHKAC
jgi:hypothetical protein